MHKFSAFRPSRTIIYASLAQERAWGCEYPLGDPWGGAAYGEKNKGGFFSSGYWENGGILNSFTSFVSDPFQYTNERLKELDKTVFQPVGRTFEAIGKSIEKDPLAFVATIAAAATGQWYIVALTQMAITASKGGDLEDVLKAGAIAAVTSYVASAGTEYLTETMKVGAQTAVEATVESTAQTATQTAAEVAIQETAKQGAQYAIAGVSISATTARTLASMATQAASRAVVAGVSGQNVLEAALAGAVTAGVSGFLVGNITPTEVAENLGIPDGANNSVFSGVKEALDSVNTALAPTLANAIGGAAGAALTGLITGKDMTNYAVLEAVQAGVGGIMSAIKVSNNLFGANSGDLSTLDPSDPSYIATVDLGAGQKVPLSQYLDSTIGPAGTSILAGIVTNVVATSLLSGEAAPILTSRLMGTIGTAIGQAVKPEFGKLANEVSEYFNATERTSKDYVDAVNARNDIAKEIKSTYDSYKEWTKQRDDVYAEYERVYNQYISTQNRDLEPRLLALLDQVDSLDKDLATIYDTRYKDRMDSLMADLKVADKVVETKQKDYADATATLDRKAEPLTSLSDQVAKTLVKDVVKNVIDPNFNEEEYKTVNNLGSGIDAYTHYLSIGKDEGYATNLEAAKAGIDAEKTRLINDIITQQGYSGITQLTASQYNKLSTMIDKQYGNNLYQLKNATTENITQWKEFGGIKSMDEALPKYDKATADAAVATKMTSSEVKTGWYQEQARKNYTPPQGMEYATQDDILAGNAKAVATKDGWTVWLKPDLNFSGIRKFDPVTGKMEDIPNIVIYGDKDVYVDEDGVVNVKAGWGDSLEDVDPYTAVATFSSMDKGIVTDVSKITVISAAQDIINAAQKSGNTTLIDISTAILKTGFGEQFTNYGAFAKLVGAAETGSSLSKVGNDLTALANANTRAEFTAAMKKFEDNYQNKEGFWDTVKGYVNGVVEMPYEFVVGVAIPEISQAIIPAVATAAVSTVGTVGAAATAALGLGSKALPGILNIAANIAGKGTGAALEMMESGGAGYIDGYNTTYNLAIKQGMSEAVAKELADKNGTAMALVNLVTTAGSLKFGTNIINKGVADSITGTAAKETADTVTGLLSKLAIEAGKGTLKDAVGETVIEGVPQALIKGTLMKAIDPKFDVGHELGVSVASSFLTSVGSTGPILASGSLVSSLPTLAVMTSTKFNDAYSKFQNGDYTMGELGAVINSVVPPDKAAEVKGTMVEYMAADKNFAGKFKDAAEFITELRMFGVRDVGNLEVAVNQAFDKGYITRDEARQALSQVYAEAASMTERQLSAFTGVKTEEQFNTAVDKLIDPKNLKLSENEVRKLFAANGFKPTDAEVAQFVNAAAGQGTKDIKKYISDNSLDIKEIKAEFKKLGYTATDAEAKAIAGQKSMADAVKDIEKYVGNKQVTYDEAKAELIRLGITEPTDAQIKKFVSLENKALTYEQAKAAIISERSDQGEFTAPTDAEIRARMVANVKDQDKIFADMAKYAAPLVNTKEEIDAIAAKQGYKPTEEDYAKYVGNVVKGNSLADFTKYADANALSTVEASTKLGALKYIPTNEELKALTGNKDEKTALADLKTYVEANKVPTTMLKQALLDAGWKKVTTADLTNLGKFARLDSLATDAAKYVSDHTVTQGDITGAMGGNYLTDAQIKANIKQGANVNKATVLANLTKKADAQVTDQTELAAAAAELGVPMSMIDLQGAYNKFSGAAGTTDTKTLAAFKAQLQKDFITTDKVKKMYADAGIAAPSDAQLAPYVGRPISELETVKKSVTDYATPIGLTTADAKAIFARNNWVPTTAELNMFANKQTQQEADTNIAAYVAQQKRDKILAAYKAAGVTEPTQSDVDKFLNQYKASNLNALVKAYAPTAKKNALVNPGDVATGGINDVTSTAPTKGETKEEFGNIYTYDGKKWVYTKAAPSTVEVAAPTEKPYTPVGTQKVENGDPYVWTGTAWQIPQGAEKTVGAETKFWDGNSWESKIAPTITIAGETANLPVPYDYNKTVGQVASYGDTKYVWNGQSWQPVNIPVGTATIENGQGFQWTGYKWAVVDPKTIVDSKIKTGVAPDLKLDTQLKVDPQTQTITSIKVDPATQTEIKTDTGTDTTTPTPPKPPTDQGTTNPDPNVIPDPTQPPTQITSWPDLIKLITPQPTDDSATKQKKQQKQQEAALQLAGMLNQTVRPVQVDTPPPKPIEYYYDFSSIFATPKQASMMPSPYGAFDIYGAQQQPQQQQFGLGSFTQAPQAANQPMFKNASGFAEGGMIDPNTLQVGDGGSIDDLLQILKGK